MQLPVKLKQDWIAALRSGEYQQGRAKLYDSTLCTYCCLGVLQKIGNGECEDTAMPSLSSLERMGIRGVTQDLNGYYPSGGIVCELANMNDGTFSSEFSGPCSFAEIADWIEENIETY